MLFYLTNKFTVANAFASIVFPVPGGPNNNTPFHGLFIPVKNYGINKGKITAYFNIFFAYFN